MSDEPAILGHIREALEAVVTPHDAALVLLDALGRWGPRVPASSSELAAFASGPLTQALGMRVDAARTLKILRQVDEILATAGAPTQERRVPGEPAWPDERTASMPTIETPVPVLVVASGQALASRLRAALDPDRVDVDARGDRAGIELALGRGAAVVLLDASDVPPVRPDDLATWMRLAPRSTIRAVWGSDLAYGRRFVELCERDERPCAAVPVGDGMEVILDLVLSRRAGPAREG